MTGVLGYIVGYGEGGETENFGEEIAVSISGGAVETVGVPAISALGWTVANVTGFTVELPSFAQAGFGLDPITAGLGIVGLFVSGTVGGFVGVQTRHFASWARQAWSGTTSSY